MRLFKKAKLNSFCLLASLSSTPSFLYIGERRGGLHGIRLNLDFFSLKLPHSVAVNTCPLVVQCFTIRLNREQKKERPEEGIQSFIQILLTDEHKGT